MKLKDGFMLRQIAEQWVVIPLGERTVEFNAMLNLSETGALIWKSLKEGMNDSDIVNLMIQEYDVDRETAETDIVSFISELTSKGLIQND